MEELTGTLVYLIIGYLCGLYFAPDVFAANILATNWGNIWAYAWLLGWPFLLLWKLFAFLFLTTPTIVVATKS